MLRHWLGRYSTVERKGQPLGPRGNVMNLFVAPSTLARLEVRVPNVRCGSRSTVRHL